MDTTALASRMSNIAARIENDGDEWGVAADLREAAARLRAVAGEPVAWRYRHQDSNGDWHGWHYRDHAMSQKYPDSEYQPLYTHPQPATPASGWMPIEGAPKDGSMFIGWVSAERWSQEDGGGSGRGADTSEADFCQWRNDSTHPLGGYFVNMMGQIGDAQDITHWMPLPTPPASKGGE